MCVIVLSVCRDNFTTLSANDGEQSVDWFNPGNSSFQHRYLSGLSITGGQYSLVFFPGLVVGRLFDLGYFRLVFLICSGILVGATFLAAQCTQYWQILLCQGILVGVSAC